MGRKVEGDSNKKMGKGKKGTVTKMEGRLPSDAFGSERHMDCVVPRRENNHLSN
jgi:hypothetical protein